jgi:hypothetical protein
MRVEDTILDAEGDAEGEAPRLFLKGHVNSTCLVALTFLTKFKTFFFMKPSPSNCRPALRSSLRTSLGAFRARLESIMARTYKGWSRMARVLCV